ncbi:unnamed protein product [Diatraea saccharalis]|uniref:Uncharacterized protein n=1 Tax=Diatraea saccharalis TaxID=40085 RepID=A0A9N9R7P0_9NEOP|nr:unnamed protein product [Diatraea saccharalis]
MLQQKIRSNNQNFFKLQILYYMDMDCDIKVLSECWLTKNCNTPCLNDYNHYSTTVNLNQNNRVIVYVNNQLDVTVDKLILSEANCFVLKFDSDTVLIAIYRPPCFRN